MGDTTTTADVSVFQRGSDTANSPSTNIWEQQTYPRATRMSPRVTTNFISFRNPTLYWLTMICLIILNSILFVLYVLDAVGIGFRSPITLVATSGALFLLFCCLSLYSVFKFKYERLLQDWLRMVSISLSFTFINLLSFLSFLAWALQNPGFWKDIDFEDDPKAHDGYVAINAFSAAIFVMAVLNLWIAMVIHYYFKKLLQTLNVVITKAGNAGNIEDIMTKVTEGGKKTAGINHKFGTMSNTYSNENSYTVDTEAEANQWRTN